MSNAKPKPLVNKATKDDRSPPDGFVLKELAQKTNSVEDCVTIEEAILKKLESNKPYVKYKALCVIKYVCENGSHNWRRAWQRHTDKVRACANFRGPPDPIYLDAPYEQVRNAAKQCMQAIFATNQTENKKPFENRIIGKEGNNVNNNNNNNSNSNSKSSATFPSGSHGVFSTPAIPPPSKSKMQGFGSDPYVPDPKAKAKFQPIQKPPDYNVNQFNVHENPHSTMKIDASSTRPKGKRLKKGQVGGRWASGNDDESKNNSNKHIHKHQDKSDDEEDSYPSNNNNNNNNASKIGGRVRSIQSDGSFEKQWVDNITKSGGVGAKIHDLDKYVQQFANLSHQHVLEYLDERLLDEDNWQCQAKALTLIDALLDSKDGVVVEEYFVDSSENLEELLKNKRKTLSRLALKICERIGIDIDFNEDNNNNNNNNESNHNNYNHQAQQQQGQIENDMDNDFLQLPVPQASQSENDLEILELMNSNEDSMFNNLNVEQDNSIPITDTTLLLPKTDKHNNESSLLPNHDNHNNNKTKSKARAIPDDILKDDIFGDLVTNNNNNNNMIDNNDVMASFTSNGNNNNNNNNNNMNSNVMSGFDFIQPKDNNKNISPNQNQNQNANKSSGFTFINEKSTSPTPLNTINNINNPLNSMNMNMNNMQAMMNTQMFTMMQNMNMLNNMQNVSPQMRQQMLAMMQNMQSMNNDNNHLDALNHSIKNINFTGYNNNNNNMNNNNLNNNLNLNSNTNNLKKNNTYNVNDPFAAMIESASNTTATVNVPPPRPKVPEKDPFADLNVLKM